MNGRTSAPTAHSHDFRHGSGHTRDHLVVEDLLRGVQTKCLPQILNAQGILTTPNWMPIDVAKGQASLILLARLGHCFDPHSASHLAIGVTTGEPAENDELLADYFRKLKEREERRLAGEHQPPTDLDTWLDELGVEASSELIWWRMQRVIAENDAYWNTWRDPANVASRPCDLVRRTRWDVLNGALGLLSQA